MTADALYTQQQAAVFAAQAAIQSAIDSFLSTMSPLIATLNAANDNLTSAANQLAAVGLTGARRLPAVSSTAARYTAAIQAYIAAANADPARNGGLTPLGPTS